jgi:glycosyltransferase involved in cell wall biosynthesis
VTLADHHATDITRRTETRRTVLFVLNDARFFVTHRIALAHGLRQAGYDVHVAVPFNPEFTEEIVSQGFPTHKIAIERQGVNPLRDLRALWQLIHLYRQLRPSLVHHVTVKPVLYGTVAARVASVPAVVNAISGLGTLLTARGLLSSIRSGVVRAIYRVVLRHENTTTIFQNEHDRSTFLRAKIVEPASSVLVPGSGTRLESFDPWSEPSFPPVVILPARLLRQKGVGDFVEAAKMLKSEGVIARFILVGDRAGNRDAVSEDELKLWTREGVVEVAGWVNDIPGVMAQASVVCLPTYYGEGIPKALIDACAAGRSIVATDVPGCRDVVTDGVNGILVPPRDPSALAKALRSLLDNPSLMTQMGRTGRTIAETKFDIAIVIRLTLEAYDRAMRA